MAGSWPRPTPTGVALSHGPHRGHHDGWVQVATLLPAGPCAVPTSPTSFTTSMVLLPLLLKLVVAVLLLLLLVLPVMRCAVPG